MKTVIYGIGDYGNRLVKRLINRSDVVICAFVQTIPNCDEYMGYKVITPQKICWDEIDAVAIASLDYYDEMLEELKKQPSYRKNKVYRYDEFLNLVYGAPYGSCGIENNTMSFIYRKDDYVIPARMILIDRTYAYESIDAFFSLVKEHYGDDFEKEGFFLDIGANIGTTSIYVKKKHPGLKVMAFELCSENYDILRCNTIINHVEDIIVINKGISNINGEVYYNYVPFNSGASGIATFGEQGYVATLDSVLDESGIKPRDISFIWIDTEGHEMEVITGAKKTLESKKIPLFQEFNAQTYCSKRELMNSYSELLGKVYSGFIDVERYLKGNKEVISIKELLNYIEKSVQDGERQTDILFV